jgi:uncharacterized RDD family membrane protein YckC
MDETKTTPTATVIPALDDQLAIRTPEHIELQYTLAGLGSRFFALLLDSFIQWGLIFIIFILFLLVMGLLNRLLGYNPLQGMPGLLLAALGVLFFFLLLNGYFLFFETLWNGQTPGKRAMKVRVLREDGRPISFFEVMVRNVLRLADMLPGNYALGALVILFSKRNKRLGDYAAGTVVIKERRQQVPDTGPRTRIEVTPHLNTISGPQFQGVLSSDEQMMITRFLHRRYEMDPAARAQLAQRLALTLAQRLNLPQPMNLPYEALLEWAVGLRTMQP